MLENELKKLRESIEGLTEALLSSGAGAPVKTRKTLVQEAPPEQAPDDLLGGIDPPADAITMTIEQVRAKLLPVIQSKGPASVQEALKSLGVEKLTEMSADQYPALLTKVSELSGVEV